MKTIRGDEILLTFNQWKRLGYFVVRGAKSFTRNASGIATFSEKQVTTIKEFECDATTDDIY